MGEKIKGYNTLDDKQLDDINRMKEAELALGGVFNDIRRNGNYNNEQLNKARDKFMEGFYWYVRAIANPDKVFDDK